MKVSTEIAHFRSFRATRHNWIFRAGVLLVECETDWVWIDPN